MFDFLIAWMFNYNAVFLIGCVLGFIAGFGTRELWAGRRWLRRKRPVGGSSPATRETSGAAYDACEEPPPDDDAVARRLLNY